MLTSVKNIFQSRISLTFKKNYTCNIYCNLSVGILFQGVPGLKGSQGDPGMVGMQVTNQWHKNSIKYVYTMQAA